MARARLITLLIAMAMLGGCTRFHQTPKGVGGQFTGGPGIPVPGGNGGPGQPGDEPVAAAPFVGVSLDSGNSDIIVNDDGQGGTVH